MRLSLLDMVQDILNDTDGDEVNSISDTVESEQAAAIVRSTFLAQTSNREWAQHKQFVTLSPFSDSERPTHVSVPDNVKRLLSLYYNKTNNTATNITYSEVFWKEPDDFLRYVFGRNSSNENVKTVTDPSGAKLFILKNKAPEYYTSFNDETLVFDSYDSEVDATIQSSKIQALAFVTPEWSHVDDFVPDIPDEAFAALVEESKSKFAFKIRQLPDEKSEQESRRQQTYLSRNNWKVKGGVKYPNYGRK